MAEKIKLKSCDGKIIEVDEKIAMMSGTIKTMLAASIQIDKDDEVIPLSCVESSILAKIVEWAEKHVNDPVDLSECDDSLIKRSDDIPQWDIDFFNVDKPTLFAITNAANFLDIKKLLDSSCKIIANMIKKNSIEDIRLTFNITPIPRPPSPKKTTNKDDESESSEGVSSH